MPTGRNDTRFTRLPVSPSVQVLHYLELEERLQRSGIGSAVSHQRKALSRTNVEVIESPSVTGRVVGDVDLVHCNMIGPGTLAVVAHACRTDTPLVLHAHVTGEDFAESFRGSTYLSGPLRTYLRFLYSQADLVCCPSNYTRDVLRSYPVDAPIRPITNGVDIDALAGHESLREQYRSRFDLSGMVVFAVGNVFERKGLSTFCRIARTTPYDFAWFGPYDTGPLASRTVKRWTRTPPGNVTFTGWIDDVRGAYGAGDVFLFPTKDENQGIAILEAMACGKPVVLRRLPVFEEFYTHGEDCLLCETVEEFRDALRRLKADPDLRERLGENARETAAEHDIERVASELASTYETVVNGKAFASEFP